MRNLFLLFVTLCFSSIFAQVTQTVRGKVVDKESKYPLIGANILVITDTLKPLGAATDLDGNYRIEGVKLGRHKIRISSVGYYDKIIPVLVNAGKELILNVELEESTIEMKAVEIKAGDENGGVKNDMALVSVTSFSVEETDKYAGSRGDPARMASNFAGIQGNDDSRNDIIIRGNSPLGVLWRVEGIDIPNPNHFSIAGASGGPVSILNNKLMSNSDFFTGAFPAEYGNSTAGVFDLKLRNGNNEKHEYTFQLGFLGTELMGEGPLSRKKGSSYLFAYRYSTLALFGGLGVPIGTNAIPQYQDLSFKLNFPQKKGGSISVFGISGLSNIDIVLSDDKDPSIDVFGEQDRDQYFGTGMGVLGMTYIKPINPKTFFKTSIAASYESQDADHNIFDRTIVNGEYQLDTIYPFLRYNFGQAKFSLSSFINKKVTKRDVLKYGINTDYYLFNFQDSIFDDQVSFTWQNRWDAQASGALIQPYIQWKHKFSEVLAINLGLHSQYYTLNNTSSLIEPRASFRWNIDEKQVLNGGVGLHSQIQPPYIHFYKFNDSAGLHNFDIGMSKSMHYVLGYATGGRGFQFKTEVYYQSLFNIPVTKQPSSFSLVNQGGTFARFFPDTLVNEGTGENYGIEVTVRKAFSKSFFMMVTGAVFDSKYTGSDDVQRNTSYNGNYAANFLIGKEFKVGKRSNFNIGAKVTWAGGKRYGVIDTLQSAQQREVIFRDSAFNELQFRDYFRADIKLNYRINTKKLTHEIGLDLVNIFNTRNLLNLTYAPTPSDPDRIVENTQLGFLPLFFYRVDF